MGVEPEPGPGGGFIGQIWKVRHSPRTIFAASERRRRRRGHRTRAGLSFEGLLGLLPCPWRGAVGRETAADRHAPALLGALTVPGASRESVAALSSSSLVRRAPRRCVRLLQFRVGLVNANARPPRPRVTRHRPARLARALPALRLASDGTHESAGHTSRGERAHACRTGTSPAPSRVVGVQRAPGLGLRQRCFRSRPFTP